MILFALPVLAGNIFQQFYNAFDSWCVGNFIVDNALAAVSSSGSLIFMMVGFFNGVAMGAGVIIAKFFGAQDYRSMQKAIHTDIAFGLTAGVALTVLGVTFTPTILGWMGTPAEVLPESISYFRYYFCGAVFSVMYNIFVGILHAVGDSRHPLYYLIFSTFINVVLDLLFVAVFHWGVGSAAVATTISQGISAFLCFLHLLRVDAPYRIKVRSIGFHLPSLKSIVRFGLPSGIQNSVISIANVVVQANINSFGKDAMAGCGTVWVPTLSTVGNLQGKGRFEEDAVRAILESALSNCHAFAAMGGILAPGSDAGAWAVPHGCESEEGWLRQALGDWADRILNTGTKIIQTRFCRQT